MPDNEEGMSLKVVLGGFVQALREAKRLGDIESARLLETYKEEALSRFPVPAFTISEVDLELRFSITQQPEEHVREQGITDLRVNVSAESLRALEAHQVSVMKVRISPVSLRALEE